MSCSCRAVAWRTFARGLSQIHRPEASSSVQLRLAVLGQSRGLHASGLRRQDGAAAVSTKRHAEVESYPALVEDTETTTPQMLDEIAPRIDAETGQQPVEKQRARKDRDRKRRTAVTDEVESYVHEKDDSHDTTSKRKWEQRAKPTPAESYPIDSTEPSLIPRPRNKEPWQIQKAALKEKFPDGWQPRKRLSPDALAGIRALNAQFPDVYTTDALADKFQVSREAIRRILKSNWRPSVVEEEDRQQRWFRRGKQVWEQKAALGIKPPQRWRMEGIARDPGYHEWSKKVSQREKEWEEEEIQKYRSYREKMKKKAEGKKGW
ncbi:hypothetical protein V8C37DRAFT_365530 [Trichoderma ceciliae]